MKKKDESLLRLSSRNKNMNNKPIVENIAGGANLYFFCIIYKLT